MARRRTPSARRKREQIAAFEQRAREGHASEPAASEPPASEPAPDSGPDSADDAAAPTPDPAAPRAPERSSRTGTGRPSSATRAASRRARAASDGPAIIACPQCGTSYRVPESAMESKITCKSCRRSFFPKATSRKSRNRNQATPYIAFGSVAVVAIIIAIIVANLGPNEVKLITAPPPPKRVDVGWNNPRVQRVVEWIKAVAAGTDFTLARSSDFASLQAVLGVQTDQPWQTTSGEDRTGLERAILDELKTGDQTFIFRDFEPAEAKLDNEEMATAQRGTVVVQLPPREGTAYHEAAQERDAESKLAYFKGSEARVAVAFAMAGDELKVTGWEILKQPSKPRPKKSKHRPHEKIAAPEVVEREFGGTKIKVTESELVPLEHLEDTPAELRAEIDQLIDGLMDMENIRYNGSIQRLQEIGRPAIPRLLNKMYEVKPVSKDDREGLKRVIMAMTALSGMQFGYNVADRKDLLIGGTPEERTSALKQWYAWWYKYHDQDFTSAIDKQDDESLLLTEEEKQAAAKKKAEGPGSEKKEE